MNIINILLKYIAPILNGVLTFYVVNDIYKNFAIECISKKLKSLLIICIMLSSLCITIPLSTVICKFTCDNNSDDTGSADSSSSFSKTYNKIMLGMIILFNIGLIVISILINIELNKCKKDYSSKLWVLYISSSIQIVLSVIAFFWLNKEDDSSDIDIGSNSNSKEPKKDKKPSDDSKNSSRRTSRELELEIKKKKKEQEEKNFKENEKKLVKLKANNIMKNREIKQNELALEDEFKKLEDIKSEDRDDDWVKKHHELETKKELLKQEKITLKNKVEDVQNLLTQHNNQRRQRDSDNLNRELFSNLNLENIQNNNQFPWTQAAVPPQPMLGNNNTVFRQHARKGGN